MTYEEFEWHILRMVYEEGVDRLRPTMLAYVLGVPVETVNHYLEQGIITGIIELDVAEDGSLEYFVPGAVPGAIPRPVWKEDEPSAQEEMVEGVAGTDGSVKSLTAGRSKRSTPILPPASLKQTHYPPTDALVPYENAELPVVVDQSAAYSDPSRTMFMRQIRIYGTQPSSEVRTHLTRLFQSFGYRMVDDRDDRMRFERGSFMFILTLIPLFVLILPLFVYLLLYVMGRSTIKQEPVELDVYMRQRREKEPFWEIDLTFVGQHGVILGAADQKVLNHEVDLLQSELSAALGMRAA